MFAYILHSRSGTSQRGEFAASSTTTNRKSTPLSSQTMVDSSPQVLETKQREYWIWRRVFEKSLN